MSFCNTTVAFEGTYSTYQIYGIKNSIKDFTKGNKLARESVAIVLHNLPGTMSTRDERSLVKELRGVSESLFITGLSVDYYSSWWSGWSGWVGDMDS